MLRRLHRLHLRRATLIAPSPTFRGLQPNDGNNVSLRRPIPPIGGQFRANSRAETSTRLLSVQATCG